MNDGQKPDSPLIIPIHVEDLLLRSRTIIHDMEETKKRLDESLKRSRELIADLDRPETFTVLLRNTLPDDRQVLTIGSQQVIHVPNGRGEELRLHLESHGIHSKVSTAAQTPFERLEIEGKVDPEILQAIVDEWEG